MSEFNLDLAVVRVKWLIVALALLGAVLGLLLKGVAWALGYLFGSTIAFGSFHATCRFVMAMGQPGTPKPGTWRIVLFGFRYLIIAGAVYVMMNVFGLSFIAALFGLLTASAATLLEILYELIHGTPRDSGHPPVQ